MSTDPVALTDEERARFQTLPVTTVEGWRAIAAAMHLLALDGYRAGQFTAERALDLVWHSALGCPAKDRVSLMFLTARHIQRQPSRPRTVDQRKVADAIKRVAVTLIDMLRETHHDWPISPENVDGTTRLLDEALMWLKALRLVTEPLSPWTLYHRWYIPTKRAIATESQRAHRRKRR